MISTYDDIIDSRDIDERIEQLEDERADLLAEVEEARDLDARLDDEALERLEEAKEQLADWVEGRPC